MSARPVRSIAFGLALIVPVLGMGAGSAAQKRAAARPKPHRSPRQASQQADRNAPLHFQDVTVLGYSSVQVDLPNNLVTITGPNATVDAKDPQDPNTTARLQASDIKVFLGGKGSSKISRAEATGNVRFNSVRSGKEGAQTFRATGSRGIYNNGDGTLRMRGPVTFAGEQPSDTAGAVQTVNGHANEAEYDQKSQVLTLTGDVLVTLVVPGHFDKPTTFPGDKITVEMAKRPYVYTIRNNSPATEGIHLQPTEPPKKKL